MPICRPPHLPAARWPFAAVLVAALWGCSSAPLPVWKPLPPLRPVPAATDSAPPPVPAPEGAVPMPIAPQAPLAPVPLARSVESPGLAARFPDPAVTYRTPAFEPDHPGYTSNAELRAFMQSLVREGDGTGQSTTIHLLQVGSSQSGIPLEALHFSRAPLPLATTGATNGPTRPTVLLVGQQHGDEPAGSEALIVIAQELAGGRLASLLDRIDVVILPRANPDGAAADRRGTASGIDMNRDHLLLRTPEAQAQAQLVREFNPAVVVDLHEFAAMGRYIEKFGAAQRFDALIQYAMVANMAPFVTKASEEWFRKPLLQGLGAQGLSNEWYYTTSTDLADKKVSMGGVQPDTGRNVDGLRNAVSFLIETRGGGLGRAHLLRRVHTHVVAISSILQSAALHADDLVKLRRYVDAEVASRACQGDTVVEAEETPSEYNLKMLDPETGADRTVNVAWDSALELTVTKRRPRPCGYWLGAGQTDAALRLRSLGVQVERLDEPGSVRGELYSEKSRDLVARSDVRGSIVDAGGSLQVKVDLTPALLDAQPGSYYVSLNQPLANLVIAAMEPDTQNSYVANRVIDDVKGEARVLARPEFRMTPLQ
jgi:hypothetical protein